MSLEKWRVIVREEEQKRSVKTLTMPFNPTSWTKVREAYIEYIAQVDLATKVYNMENKVK